MLSQQKLLNEISPSIDQQILNVKLHFSLLLNLVNNSLHFAVRYEHMLFYFSHLL